MDLQQIAHTREYHSPKNADLFLSVLKKCPILQYKTSGGKFLDPPPDLDQHQNITDSILSYKASFYQVSW